MFCLGWSFLLVCLFVLGVFWVGFQFAVAPCWDCRGRVIFPSALPFLTSELQNKVGKLYIAVFCAPPSSLECQGKEGEPLWER